MSTTWNKSVVDRFDALLGSKDLDELDKLCWPDMINHSLAPSRPKGLDGTKEFLREAGSHFENDHWDTLVVVADGDYVVQFGARGGRWPGGQFLGYPAAAGSYMRDFACIYRVTVGRIAERWAVRDDLTMLRQLAALAEPGRNAHASGVPS
jgi:predicted ester cyclase